MYILFIHLKNNIVNIYDVEALYLLVDEHMLFFYAIAG